MLDHDDGDDFRRDRSLLDLGDAMRGNEAPQPSRLMQAMAEVRAEYDAISRHRAARSRRDARENPLLHALGSRGPLRQASPAAEMPVTPPAAEPAAAVPLPSTPPKRQGRLAAAIARARAEVVSRASGEGAAAASAPVAAATASTPVDEPTEPFERARERDYAVDRREADDEPGDPEQWKPLIDPGKVFGGVRKSLGIIAAATILGAMLGVAVAVTTPKKYTAVTELLADPRDLNLVDKELTQSGLSTEATLAIVENQVRVLTSGSVLSKVVDKLNLDEDPEFNGQGRAGGLGGIVSAVKGILSSRDGSDDAGRRNALANQHLAEALDVQRGGKTFVITIAATTLSGDKSALIANTMTEVFLAAYGQLQSDAASRAAGELTAKLDELRAGVEAAERKVETFKAENDIIQSQGRLITDDEIVKLNEQLAVARARTLELNARAVSTRSVDIDTVLGGVLPEELVSATIQELRAQYSTLKTEADRLDTQLGPKHPQRQAIDAQLQVLRGAIATEINRIISSSQTELKRAVQLEQELSSRLAQLKVRQGSLSSELVTLRELERDATAKRAVYESFLLRARQTGEQSGINSANMSVISKAFPPLNPNPPSRSTIAIAGTMLGLFAGLGLGIARGTFDSLRDSMANSPGREPRRRWRLPRPAAAAAAAGKRPLSPPSVAQLAAKSEPQPADRPAQSSDPQMHDPNHAYAGPAMQPQPAGPAVFPANVFPQAPLQFGPYPQQQAAYPAQPAPVQVQQPVYAPPPQPAFVPPAAYPQPAMQPQMQPAYPQVYAPQPAYWPSQPVQAAPMPQPMAPQPMQPAPAYAYPYPQQPVMAAQPQPVYAPPPMPAPQYAAAAQPVPSAPVAAEQSPIEEIRASLRECRDAIRDLTDSRTRRRRYF